MSGLTYKDSGVDYGAMDPFKRMAQLAGRETAVNIRRRHGGEFREVETSRGESAYLIEAAKSYFAHVEEGLGTKNLVADAMYRLTGRSYYDQIAQCTVAMIVNDMITLGALPFSVAMHLAVGESGWFDDEKRCRDLVEGWKNACNLAGCAWGGGETPTLKGIVFPGTAVLSGSAMGLIKPKERLIEPANIRHGDSILLVGSSGVHANGLTLCRKIADQHPEGYMAKLSDGTTFGEALLKPTVIYVPVVEALQDAGIKIHYAVNITGHGWRKLMRAQQPFVYVIDNPPTPQPVFEFIQKQGPVDNEEAWGNYNMGAGFALYVAPEDTDSAVEIIADRQFAVWVGGHIENRGGEKKVVIVPKITFEAETLQVR